ncbi:hypothetical protein [Dietzia sp. UBA5065]|uniref:hypothetical protein n=1 Tax=Dietzia sp. UBA5065 TaxID=1946422 RepID=UPI0025BBA1EF|nr:hypothetical protein [Dietzia sp. UBA5065]
MEPVVASGAHEDDSSASRLVVDVDDMTLEFHPVVVTTQAAVGRRRSVVVDDRGVAPDGTEQPPWCGILRLRLDSALDFGRQVRGNGPREGPERVAESTLHRGYGESVRVEAEAVEVEIVRSSGTSFDRVQFDDRRPWRVDDVQDQIPALAPLRNVPSQVFEV